MSNTSAGATSTPAVVNASLNSPLPTTLIPTTSAPAILLPAETKPSTAQASATSVTPQYPQQQPLSNQQPATHPNVGLSATAVMPAGSTSMISSITTPSSVVNPASVPVSAITSSSSVSRIVQPKSTPQGHGNSAPAINSNEAYPSSNDQHYATAAYPTDSAGHLAIPAIGQYPNEATCLRSIAATLAMGVVGLAFIAWA
ncbi:hypothetical protein BZG36_00563 [Bifiguratus adelaidae]|uniref:Uncharacterized protein n=1 Tax=Bifiguratus adelaidae TaxID=1938954 RepID=A0A261Y7G5_9FUNG|nr:hypothetical protein BZG36_00563 [Bifiguratus adelaidae]